MIDGYDFFYGNSKVELGFKVNTTPDLVIYLENCGFIDSEDVDERVYDETDYDDWNIMAEPIFDAIIEYYEDRAESILEVECGRMNNGEPYDEEFVAIDSDVDRVFEVASLDPVWRGLGGYPLVECGYHYDHREQ